MLSKFKLENYDYIIDAFSMMKHDEWNRVWDAVTRMESKDDLVNVKCPTLLLVGDHDTITNPHAELKVIHNAHHGTNLDNPNMANELILEFVKRETTDF